MNLKEYLHYNPNTGIFTWIKLSSKYSRIKIGQKAGCNNGAGYICIEINNKNYKAHRLAWYLYYGTWPKGQIDHINGVKEDNRINNLRDVTSSTNSKNRTYHRKRELRPLLNIHYRKSKDFYEVIINNKYIGGSIDLNRAIQIRDNYLTTKSNTDTI